MVTRKGKKKKNFRFKRKTLLFKICKLWTKIKLLIFKKYKKNIINYIFLILVLK